jgi:ribulose-5-phosphate 4-epimerase/fuculose-1-phosphate aldolase
VETARRRAGSLPIFAADEARIDLAAAFRVAAMMNWHEAVVNHFSVATSPDGSTFLINPRWRHFSAIRASELIEVQAGEGAQPSETLVDPTAWFIHGSLHRALPQARCVLHVHPPYATALASLKDPAIKPIDQNTARFFNRVAIDLGFGGIADSREEGARIAQTLDRHTTMIMGNHGVLVVGRTIAHAVDELYYLERACRTLVLAYSTGQPLNVMPDDLAERTAAGWETYQEDPLHHFRELKLLLDNSDPTYRE